LLVLFFVERPFLLFCKVSVYLFSGLSFFSACYYFVLDFHQHIVFVWFNSENSYAERIERMLGVQASERSFSNFLEQMTRSQRNVQSIVLKYTRDSIHESSALLFLLSFLMLPVATQLPSCRPQCYCLRHTLPSDSVLVWTLSLIPNT
jgi:hypothetical protein